MFMSNVLSRLEAVMGIQIVSVLASSYISKLTSSSGVTELQQEFDEEGKNIALPDPLIDPICYVEEVIAQWSRGHSDRLPTWRQLFLVLQDIGLPELSQQMEAFMKGKNYLQLKRFGANNET